MQSYFYAKRPRLMFPKNISGRVFSAISFLISNILDPTWWTVLGPCFTVPFSSISCFFLRISWIYFWSHDWLFNVLVLLAFISGDAGTSDFPPFLILIAFGELLVWIFILFLPFLFVLVLIKLGSFNLRGSFMVSKRWLSSKDGYRPFYILKFKASPWPGVQYP